MKDYKRDKWSKVVVNDQGVLYVIKGHRCEVVRNVKYITKVGNVQHSLTVPNVN